MDYIDDDHFFVLSYVRGKFDNFGRFAMRKILLLIFLLSVVLPACGESDWGPDMQAAVISALQARADDERAAFNEVVLDEGIWENIRGCEGKDFSSAEFTYEDNWGEG